MEPLLKASGFIEVVVKLKEESRDFIKNWLPGSGCENFVVSAEITARKPKSEKTHCSTSVATPETTEALAASPKEEEGC